MSRSEKDLARTGARWPRAERATVLGAGLYLHVDEQDSLGLLTSGDYEPYETSLLLALAAPGTTVVDIGANIGYHTVQFAHAVGPTGRVIAFEPDPDNLRVLGHNIRTNALHNVTVIPKAAAATTGPLELFISAENRGDHRVYDSGDGRQVIRIDAVAADEVLEDVVGHVSLIKLDIQGAEPMALRGMQRFLEKHPEAWIATELWPAGLEHGGSSLDAYLGQLRAFGAALLRVDEGRRRLAPLDLEWLTETVTVERDNHTNLLLPRRDWIYRAGAPPGRPASVTASAPRSNATARLAAPSSPAEEFPRHAQSPAVSAPL